MTVKLRPAERNDATDLAAFVDMAGEGLPTYFWSELAEVGQSPFEVGRARAQREEGSFSYRNAVIAELDGEVAGGLVGYPLPDLYDTGDLAALSDIVRPLVVLESQAPGYWYVNVLAVYPEFRRQGIAAQLLATADDVGQALGCKGMAIIVASENQDAYRLYQRSGYEYAASEKLVAFPGYKRGGDWLLLTKSQS